jgi:P27 family predicted phage terminase small subunit
MGRRGPPPKPTRLKAAAGNPGHRPLNPAEPRPAVAVPACPTWLPKRAKAEWRRITPELHRLGLVALIDAVALASYCVAVAELEEATRTLEKEGRVSVWVLFDKQGVKVGERLKAHPAVAMQRDAARLVKQFVGEFGLTPASRTRVSGSKAGDDGGGGKGARFFNTIG